MSFGFHDQWSSQPLYNGILLASLFGDTTFEGITTGLGSTGARAVSGREDNRGGNGDLNLALELSSVDISRLGPEFSSFPEWFSVGLKTK